MPQTYPSETPREAGRTRGSLLWPFLGVAMHRPRVERVVTCPLGDIRNPGQHCLVEIDRNKLNSKVIETFDHVTCAALGTYETHLPAETSLSNSSKTFVIFTDACFSTRLVPSQVS